MKVDLAELRKVYEYLGKINRTELSKIIILDSDKGIKIHPSKDEIEEWKFCGLSNTDFLRMLKEY